eukprot:12906264-Prorocentrum_lima.AAC.1
MKNATGSRSTPKGQWTSWKKGPNPYKQGLGQRYRGLMNKLNMNISRAFRLLKRQPRAITM